MKHAVLILCGEEYHRLPLLINQFDDRFRVYVHIDKKVTLPQGFMKRIMCDEIVRGVFQQFVTNWGSMNIVNAILYLCERALKEEDNTHFHLISGSDFPIASNDRIMECCQTEKDNYIEYFSLPTPRWNDGGMSRLQYFHALDVLDFRNPKDKERYVRFVEAQKFLGIKRQLLEIPYYGGSTWWSLSRKCVEYIVVHRHIHNIYASMQDTYVPDEMFIQTLLLNSPLGDFLTNDNRRYILWKCKNGHIPANLDMEDYDDIVHSNCLFMRKTDQECSQKLVLEVSRLRFCGIRG